mgnify:CR=1 FL=1
MTLNTNLSMKNTGIYSYVLLKQTGKRSIERSSTGNKNMPYKFSVKYNPEELDTNPYFQIAETSE